MACIKHFIYLSFFKMQPYQIIPLDAWKHIGTFLQNDAKKRMRFTSRIFYSLFHQSIRLKKTPPANLLPLLKNVHHIYMPVLQDFILPFANQLKSLTCNTILRLPPIEKIQFLNLCVFELAGDPINVSMATWTVYAATNCKKLKKALFGEPVDTLPIFPELEEIFIPLRSQSLIASLKAQPSLKKIEVSINKFELLKWIEPHFTLHLESYFNYDDTIFDLEENQLLLLKEAKLLQYYAPKDVSKKTFFSAFVENYSDHPRFVSFFQFFYKHGFPLYFTPDLTWEIHLYIIGFFPNWLENPLPSCKENEAKDLYIWVKHSEIHKKYLLNILALILRSHYGPLFTQIMTTNPELANLTDEQGNNFLHLIAKHACFILPRIFGLLDTFNFDFNLVNKNRRTPIEEAILSKNEWAIIYFITNKKVSISLETWSLALQRRCTRFFHSTDLPLTSNSYNQNILHFFFYHDLSADFILPRVKDKKVLPLFFLPDFTGLTPLELGLNRFPLKNKGGDEQRLHDFLHSLTTPLMRKFNVMM